MSLNLSGIDFFILLLHFFDILFLHLLTGDHAKCVAEKKPQHPGFPCGPPPWY
jgi:hypothetical protein